MTECNSTRRRGAASRKMRSKHRLAGFASASLVALALAIGGGAFAQTPPPQPAAQGGTGTIEEIVVTASKRSEPLQSVPVSVTVVSGDQLERQNVTDVDELSRSSPALTSTSGPAGAISIRGIGTQSFARTAEASVGVVVDNVALANASASDAPSALFDVARVEVLEGPQGTLFGRNSSAGVLNITTNAPDFDEYAAMAHADFGSRDGQILQSAVNLPLDDQLALRLAGHLTRSPETVYSADRGEWDQDDDEGLRARLRWQPRQDLSVNLIADYDKTHLRNYTWTVSNDTPGGLLAHELASCGVVASTRNDATCLDGGVYGVFENFGVSGQVDYQLGDYTLTSITASRWLIVGPSALDSDSIPLDYLDTNYTHLRTRNVSEELRLTSPSTDRLSYVAGLYYFDSSQGADGGQAGTLGVPLLEQLNGLAGQTFITTAELQSAAGFGQATYHVTDDARVIFGGRLDHEDVRATTTRALYPGALANFTTIAPIHGHDEDLNLSYRLGGEYDVTKDIMTYVTYTRGYKGPAVNDQSTSLAAPAIVQPEIPHDVELGVKTSELNRNLAVNLALFHNQIDNFQTTIFDPTTAGYVFGNAPSLTSQGVELSVFGRPIPELTINGGINYTDATYGAGLFTPCGPVQTAAQGCVTTTAHGVTVSSTDVQGRRLIGAPRWKATLSGEYAQSLSDRFEAYLQLDGVYTSSINFNAAPDPLDGTGAHFVLGGRLGLRTSDGRYGIAAYARNLTDERVPSFVVDTPLAAQLGDLNSHSQYFGPDSFRTIGVTFDVSF